MQVHRRATIQIAVGVGCFILSISTLLLAEWLTGSDDSAQGVASMFSMVIIGLALVIPAGISLSQFKVWEGAKLVVPLTEGDRLETGRRQAWRSLSILIPAGIGFILLGIIGEVSLTQWIGHDDPWADSLMLALVAFGVQCFIVAGMHKARFDRLLNRDEYRPRSVQSRQRSRIGEAMAGVFWVLVQLGYFVWSFGWDAWETSWMIWPVASLIFAAGAIIFQAVSPDRD